MCPSLRWALHELFFLTTSSTVCSTFCIINHRCMCFKWGSSEPGCKCGMTTALSVGVVNSLSNWMVCPNFLLHYCIQVKHPFHWHWTFEMDAMRGHLEPSGVPPAYIQWPRVQGWKTDGWWAWAGQPVPLQTAFHHCGSRWVLSRAAVEGSVWLCGSGHLGGVKVLYHHITEAPYISIHQEASRRKGKWSLCLKSCSNDLWTLPASSAL